MKVYFGDNAEPTEPLAFSFTYTDPFTGESRRNVTVSPKHPRLYALAQQAEADGDRETMRAVARAAKEATSGKA